MDSLPEGLQNDLVRVSSSMSDSKEAASTADPETLVKTTTTTLMELPRGGVNIGDTVTLPEGNFGSIGEVNHHFFMLTAHSSLTP